MVPGYDVKHVYLRQMLECRLEIDHVWCLPVGSLGKGLKKRLPGDIWKTLEQTYYGANLADNWMALLETMELFRQVSMEVGNYFGYAYPDELHRRVIRYIEHINQMDEL